MSEESQLDLAEICGKFAQACDPNAGQAPVMAITNDPNAGPGF